MAQLKKLIKIKYFTSRSKYFISYAHTPEKWHATPITIKCTDGAKLAEQWAIDNESLLHSKKQKCLILSDFSTNFFSSDGQWYQTKIRKGRSYHGSFLLSRERWLNSYIIPKFGRYDLRLITAIDVDNWLMDVKSKSKNEQLSNESKNRLLVIFKTVLKEAKRQGLLEINPLENIEFFARNSVKREIFNDDELGLMFPHDDNQAKSIWGTNMWIAFFYIMRDTGHRPSEQLALTWADYNADKQGFIISKKVDGALKKVVNGTKSGKNRATLVSSYTHQLIKQWYNEKDHKESSDLIFFNDEGSNPLITVEGANKHFKMAMIRAGVKVNGRTQYCLRHTVNTRLKSMLGHNEQLRTLMGHSSTAMTNNYNNPTNDHMFNEVASLKSVIEQLSK